MTLPSLSFHAFTDNASLKMPQVRERYQENILYSFREIADLISAAVSDVLSQKDLFHCTKIPQSPVTFTTTYGEKFAICWSWWRDIKGSIEISISKNENSHTICFKDAHTVSLTTMADLRSLMIVLNEASQKFCAGFHVDPTIGLANAQFDAEAAAVFGYTHDRENHDPSTEIDAIMLQAAIEVRNPTPWSKGWISFPTASSDKALSTMNKKLSPLLHNVAYVEGINTTLPDGALSQQINLTAGSMTVRPLGFAPIERLRLLAHAEKHLQK